MCDLDNELLTVINPSSEGSILRSLIYWMMNYIKCITVLLFCYSFKMVVLAYLLNCIKY